MTIEQWDYPTGAHMEYPESLPPYEHPGYHVVTCSCGRKYHVGNEAPDSGNCGDRWKHK